MAAPRAVFHSCCSVRALGGQLRAVEDIDDVAPQILLGTQLGDVVEEVAYDAGEAGVARLGWWARPTYSHSR